ncbi:MAG: nucleotide exchange factor GrpE [Candidatus Dojkabacteria bacterium]
MDKNSKPTQKFDDQVKDTQVNQSTEKELEQLQNEIKTLAATIDKVEDEKLKLENSLKKALADYINLEKTIDNRIEIRAMHLKKDLAKGIIEVLDDLKYAYDAQTQIEMTAEVKAWAEGMFQSADKLNKALESIGITKMILNVGDEFNSSLHEAVAVVPGEKNGTIHEIVQAGFMLGEIVVRPARVVVVKA